ncbi:MAG: DegQ family serine endoprotease [Pseudomonadales bacterium]|nr:DegQ family serine endoprotease [Pseudomonadales bacterium]
MLTIGFLAPLLAVSANLPDFTGLIEKNSPAVVKINTVAKVGGASRIPNIPYGELPEIFRDFFDGYRDQQPREARSMGSGFIISEDGYVLTNHHVIERADDIMVRLSDRREFSAKVIGADKRSDLALLKINADDLPTVTFAEPEDLKVGEWVVAIGSPFGLDYSASAGIISAIGRSIPTKSGDNYVPFIQSDVAINPGNSGGPLFNLDGEVVGINSQIYTRSGGSIGVSFAIPTSLALEVVDQLKAKGRVDRGWLGVYIQDIDKELAESLELDRPQGALIVQVEPDGPADKAGIRAGDVILSFDGKSIDESGDLPHVVGLLPPGKNVTAQLMRKGKSRTVKVEVGALPGQVSAQGDSPGQGDRLGLSLRELDEKSARNWNLRGGVVITEVFPDTAAARTGLRPGDVIVQLGYNAIQNLQEYQAIIDDLPEKSPVAIRFFRAGRPVFRTIEIR